MEFSEASSPGHESKGSEDHIHLPPNDLLASLTSALLAVSFTMCMYISYSLASPQESLLAVLI